MKKLILTSGLALIMMASCKKKDEPAPPTPPPIEDPAPPPAPKPMTQTPPPAVQPPPVAEPDGTSVSVGSDGISVKNKNGDAKNNVTISRQKAEMEIKTDKQ